MIGSVRRLALVLSACLLTATLAHAACLNGYPSVAGEYKGANAVVVATVLAEGFVPSSDKEFYDGTMYRIGVDRYSMKISEMQKRFSVRIHRADFR